MSIRRINSTGRKRILREHTIFTIQADASGGLTLTVALDLGEYELPVNASVFVEAYRQTSLMRFDFGTVGSCRFAEDVSPQLSEFSSPEGILFRVKVSSADGRRGLLLAEGDRIPVADEVETPENRTALLPPLPADLGQESWLVSFADPSRPYLLINKRFGDWKAIAASPAFRAVAFPAAMREILWYIYKVRGTEDMEDRQDWGCQWLRFASSLPGTIDPPFDTDDDQWEEWIASVVRAFADKHQLFDKHVRALAEDQG